jgi:hypothetical protein
MEFNGEVIEIGEERDKKGRDYETVKIKGKDKKVRSFVSYGRHLEKAEIQEGDWIYITPWEKNDRYIDSVEKKAGQKKLREDDGECDDVEDRKQAEEIKKVNYAIRNKIPDEPEAVSEPEIRIPTLFSFLQVASRMIAPISTHDTAVDPKENVEYWKKYAGNTVLLASVLRKEYAERAKIEASNGAARVV